MSLFLCFIILYYSRKKYLIYGQYTFVDGLHTLSKVVASLQLHIRQTQEITFPFRQKAVKILVGCLSRGARWALINHHQCTYVHYYIRLTVSKYSELKYIYETRDWKFIFPKMFQISGSTTVKLTVNYLANYFFTQS